MTQEEFIKLSLEIHNNKYLYDKVVYVNKTTKVIITCPIHGDFITTPYNHISCETGCPKCGREKANLSESDTKEDFIRKAAKTHYNKYNYSKVNYINSNTKITIICPEHGEFQLKPASHVSGQGCPKCQLKSLTILYTKLVEKFPNLEILFEVGSNIVPWLEKQRFDIYIPLLNIAIEYNGHQHYVPVEYFGGTLGLQHTLERDELKRLKCKDNGCLLYELKYNYTNEDFDNLCLEVTKKLEELYKDGSDEASIEAGKLLVKEILFNTEDRTGLIAKCLEGGKL